MSHSVHSDRLLDQVIWRIHELPAGDDAGVVDEDCDVSDFLFYLEIDYKGGKSMKSVDLSIHLSLYLSVRVCQML